MQPDQQPPQVSGTDTREALAARFIAAQDRLIDLLERKPGGINGTARELERMRDVARRDVAELRLAGLRSALASSPSQDREAAFDCECATSKGGHPPDCPCPCHAARRFVVFEDSEPTQVWREGVGFLSEAERLALADEIVLAPAVSSQDTGGGEVEDAGEWRLYRASAAPDGIVVMGNPPPRLEVGQYVHVFAVPRADNDAPMPAGPREWRAHCAFHRLAVQQRDAAWRELENLRVAVSSPTGGEGTT